ncbi:hypothetical protein [Nonomuraea sp. NEAU-A123]|uniref:hypothetical protein n=1 Tax=Nonomuraea sp. NEAU-A123 TaxID=2839649 RepID=UPI001BE4252F|nr:hypothetical protein [Nonomuraea sp. NEAU-A123]MBT2228546.1 hypothetical protein [Nonomuraea sp. NEAU-A123]
MDKLDKGLVIAALRCVGRAPGVVLDAVGVAAVSSAVASLVVGVSVDVGEDEVVGVASVAVAVGSASEVAAADGESDVVAVSVGEGEPGVVGVSVGEGESDVVGVGVVDDESDVVGEGVSKVGVAVGVSEVGRGVAVVEGVSDAEVGVADGASEIVWGAVGSVWWSGHCCWPSSLLDCSSGVR